MKPLFQAAVLVLLTTLVLVCGYVSRDVLGDWLIRVHSENLLDQSLGVMFGLTRVLVTLVSVLVFLLLASVSLILCVGFLQECWYQVMQRRILSIWWKEAVTPPETEPVKDEADPHSIGAPKKPVRMRRTRPYAVPRDQEVPEEEAKAASPGLPPLVERLMKQEGIPIHFVDDDLEDNDPEMTVERDSRYQPG